MTRNEILGACLIVLSLPACSGDEQAGEDLGWLESIEGPLPQKLSEVGVFADTPSAQSSAAVLVYEPEWPLWSSGARKARSLYLPPGAKVRSSGGEWEFPLGTVLSKTFEVTEDDQSVPIETRLIFRRQDGWDYAVYHWDESGSDAQLLEGNWVEQPVELAEGGTYTIPARLDCRTCHETHEGTTGNPVLGVTPYQVSDALIEQGIFESEVTRSELEGETFEETKALGYFVGNCIACHNGGSEENSAFSLYPSLARTNTVNVPTEGETAPGVRVVPGDPAGSVLYDAVVEAPLPGYQGLYPSMPPLAVDRPDPDARDILAAWILSLE